MVEIVPITQRQAVAWVNAHHRHLRGPRGDLFRAAIEIDGRLAAVGIAGRPCRALQDGRTVEITRICSLADVTVNACSRLYGALRRAGIALGYRRFVTYCLDSESGQAIIASGFEYDGVTAGGEWSRLSRLRAPVSQPCPKKRFIWPARESGLWRQDEGPETKSLVVDWS